MGLDFVELMMAVEDAFALDIPDADAETLTTPRRLIEYLHARLPASESERCLSQRAFYKIRRATCDQLRLDRRLIWPETALAPFFRNADGKQAWQDVQIEVGAAHWPRIGPQAVYERPLSPHLETFGALAEFLVTRCPVAVKEDDQLWTRNQIADVVRRLLWAEFGIEEYDEDSHFIRDLGLG